MNIIEIQDSLKDLPDSALMREMQAPTGTAPQFLVLSELKRRKRMRDDFQRRQNEDMKTVAEEVVTAAGAPQEGIMQMSRAMAPNSSIAQNTGMDTAAPVQPTQAPQMMADGGMVKMQTGGTITAIANLKVNYPELYDQYKDSPDLEQIAAAAMRGGGFFGESGIARDVPYGLDELEEGRSFDTLRSLFTDPSNRAVTKKAAEIEAMQPEINAAADAQRAAALATGAYDSDEPYVEDITKIIGRPDDPVIVDPREIVEAQVTKSPIDESVYGGQPQYMKRLNPRDTEGYVQGPGVAAIPPDRLPDYSRTGSEQSFVLQRPEGAPISRPSTMGGDRPLGLDTSTFTQPIDVRTPIGDVYADPEKIRATEDAMMAGIGSLGGPLTVSEAAVETATQRRDAPTSTQIEQPMLIDQMATASIPDDRSMEEEIRDQRERERRAEEIRADYLGTIVPDDTISSDLVDLGEAGIEGIGTLFEAGVGGLEAAKESVANTRESVAEALMQRDLRNAADIERAGYESAQEQADRAALLEGFTLGDPNAPDAEGALSFGDLLPKDTDTSTTPAGRKSTSTSGGAGGTGGGVGGRIAQMLADREKSAEADKWMALAQTGMALMASKQPTLGGALGEAGLIGVGAMQKSRRQYDKDILDLLTLQERSRRTGSKGGLTASNMISLMDDLRKYKGDIQDRIDALNSPTNLMDEEEKARQLESLQQELFRTDIELGTYRNALRGGGSTGGQSFDVSGGSQSQGGVGFSLGTPTS